MPYLDHTKLPAILATEYADSTSSRMVGTTHRADSGYFDIMRFYGPNAVDPSRVRVQVSPDLFHVTDPVIAEFASEVEAKMRQEGRLFDGPLAMKLASMEFGSPLPHVSVQPVSYGLQAATCFALDLPHRLFAEYGGTLRDYWYAIRRVRSVEANPLAICLGVCAYLMVEERGHRYLLQVRRSRRLASLEASLGPSAAGVVDYSEDYSNLCDLLLAALGQEVTEELGLKTGEFEIIPLAWAMEVFRGDRPQLFALVTTPLNRAEVSERLRSISELEREFSGYDWVELQDGRWISDRLFGELNPEGRMAYLLFQEYLDALQT